MTAVSYCVHSRHSSVRSDQISAWISIDHSYATMMTQTVIADLLGITGACISDHVDTELSSEPEDNIRFVTAS